MLQGDRNQDASISDDMRHVRACLATGEHLERAARGGAVADRHRETVLGVIGLPDHFPRHAGASRGQLLARRPTTLVLKLYSRSAASASSEDRTTQ